MKIISSYQKLYRELNKAKEGITLLPMPLNDLFYYYSKKYPSYSNLTAIVPDGMPLVWFLRFLGFAAERLYGPEVLLNTLKKHTSKKHLLLLSEAVGTAFVRKYKLKSNVRVVNLPYKKNAKELLSNEVSNAVLLKPDFIWIGISSPKQVILASEIRKINSKSHIFCVGAAFNLLLDKRLQAPKFIRNLGFEWLYRLVQEPKRLWGRYLLDMPRGLMYLKKLAKEDII